MADALISYEIVAKANEVDRLSRKIAIEQSVETPESLITSEIEAKYLARLEQVVCINESSNLYKITLAYPEQIISQQYNQLLNFAFGNVSMYPDVKLVDIKLSDQLLGNFSGPNYGVEGIREMLGVYGRPLLATALKPRGYTDEQFAQLAYGFALGGGDIIKDDQNLVGSFDEFKSRVTQCLAAIDKAQQKTGKTCLYFPFISARFEEIEKYFIWVKSQGIKGVLLAPLILGLDTARGLANKYDLIYMAHPSFTGSYCVPATQGMSYQLLYGYLYRLAGVDISVYPNTGGRFEFSEQDCKNIAYELRKPLSNIKAALPCPAGGMQYADLKTMCEWYQQDSVFLLGGSLLEYSSSLEQSTRAFKQKITEMFVEELVEPKLRERESSCDVADVKHSQLMECLKFTNFEWSGRERIAYKKSDLNSFKNVSRTELVGKNGENIEFELRYFEISKDGFSSREMHQHTHVIIAARGEGLVLIDDCEYELNSNDVVYIRPMTRHQLINRNIEPFGFYCIVNKNRDKPIAIN